MSYKGSYKGLSLYQPWASAIALGLKRYETRGWRTRYRGLLLIHASKRWTVAEQTARKEALIRIGEWVLQGKIGLTTELRRRFLGYTSVLGAIVAIADLVECWPTHAIGGMLGGMDRIPGLTDLDRLFGDFSAGRHAWQFENVVPLQKPVPCKGAMGLWNPTEDVVDRVQDQLKAQVFTKVFFGQSEGSFDV